jgi:hypothetical protein
MTPAKENIFRRDKLKKISRVLVFCLNNCYGDKHAVVKYLSKALRTKRELDFVRLR